MASISTSSSLGNRTQAPPKCSRKSEEEALPDIMEISQEDDPPALLGGNNGFTGPEDPVQHLQLQPNERTSIDHLLRISEESSMSHHGPFECQLSSGWEEAVCGWDKAFPLSCILLTPKERRNPEPRARVTLACSSSGLTLSKAESSLANVDQQKSKKPTLACKQKASQCHSPLSALQSDTAVNTMKSSTANLLIKPKIEERRPKETPVLPLKCTVPEINHVKPFKYSHGPNDVAIPLKNFIFLPPIGSAVLNSNVRMAPGGEPFEEMGKTLDKPRRRRDIRVEMIPKSDLIPHTFNHISQNHTFQPNSRVFVADDVYDFHFLPEQRTVHSTSCPMGKRATHALTKPCVHILMRNQTV